MNNNTNRFHAVQTDQFVLNYRVIRTQCDYVVDLLLEADEVLGREESEAVTLMKGTYLSKFDKIIEMDYLDSEKSTLLGRAVYMPLNLLRHHEGR